MDYILLKLILNAKSFIFFSFQRLNPLSLVQICMPIVDQIKDKDEALQFVEKLGEKIKADPAAFALTKVLQGKLQLDRFVDVEKTKVTINNTYTMKIKLLLL